MLHNQICWGQKTWICINQGWDINRIEGDGTSWIEILDSATEVLRHPAVLIGKVSSLMSLSYD